MSEGIERLPMGELLKKIAKSVVDNPDDVTVNEIVGEHTNVLELKVNEQDMGKVIGKRGATISSIRTILKNAGMRQGKRFILEIIQ